MHEPVVMWLGCVGARTDKRCLCKHTLSLFSPDYCASWLPKHLAVVMVNLRTLECAQCLCKHLDTDVQPRYFVVN